MRWRDPIPTHMKDGERRQGGMEGEQEREGDLDKFSFVYTQGAKRLAVCGG